MQQQSWWPYKTYHGPSSFIYWCCSWNQPYLRHAIMNYPTNHFFWIWSSLWQCSLYVHHLMADCTALDKLEKLHKQYTVQISLSRILKRCRPLSVPSKIGWVNLQVHQGKFVACALHSIWDIMMPLFTPSHGNMNKENGKPVVMLHSNKIVMLLLLTIHITISKINNVCA